MAKLNRMQMPKKAEKFDLSELDMGSDSEESPEEEAAESPEEEAAEPAEEESKEEYHADKLAACSDEDLMAEVRKRGLEKQLSDSEEMPEESKQEDHGM